jgi:GDP-4-dehydro-6-deoxy-D-mannose reductase
MRSYDRLLITGAGGFVGRHLLPILKAAFPTAALIAAVRPENGEWPTFDRADVVPFDLLKLTELDELIARLKPDGLVHLAAQASVAASFTDPVASWRANLLGTVALAEAVAHHVPHCRFVLASSAEIYGLSFHAPAPLTEGALLRPANPYAASKAGCDLAIGEMALRGLDAVRIRAFNHTGAGQSDSFVVAAFARQIAQIEFGKQEPVLRVGALDRWRDFLDVADVCSAYTAALAANSTSGAIYNISSGVPRRIGDILEAMLAQSSIEPRIQVEAQRLRPSDVERTVGDSRLAQQELGWMPAVPWDDTLRTVLDDWRGRIGSPPSATLPG